jgi:hypothetical protein
MKRILLKRDEFASLEEINDKSIVGIQWESEQKCMIIDTPGGYCSIADDHYPNICNVWYADSVKEYVKRSLNQGNNTNSKAYLFNNIKEIYEWMSR